MGSRFSSSCGSSALSSSFAPSSPSLLRLLNELKPVKEGALLFEPKPVKAGAAADEPKLKGADVLGNLKSSEGFLAASSGFVLVSTGSSSSPVVQKKHGSR